MRSSCLASGMSPALSQLLGLRLEYTLLTRETIVAPFFVGLHLNG
jgi:hypothetical protein